MWEGRWASTLMRSPAVATGHWDFRRTLPLQASLLKGLNLYDGHEQLGLDGGRRGTSETESTSQT